jgi:hypothetical protein
MSPEIRVIRTGLREGFVDLLRRFALAVVLSGCSESAIAQTPAPPAPVAVEAHAPLSVIVPIAISRWR